MVFFAIEIEQQVERSRKQRLGSKSARFVNPHDAGLGFKSYDADERDLWTLSGRFSGGLRDVLEPGCRVESLARAAAARATGRIRWRKVILKAGN